MSTITLISGAPGSGKSTIGKLIARRYPKCLLISVDHLREMMVSGLATPDQGLTRECIDQFQWARLSAIKMAEIYAKRGINVIIDDVCVPSTFADHYQRLFRNPVCKRVLLMPNRQTLASRIRKRGGPWDKILVKFISEIYDYLEPMPKDGWIVLDISEWTIEKTVKKVSGHLGINSSD